MYSAFSELQPREARHPSASCREFRDRQGAWTANAEQLSYALYQLQDSEALPYVCVSYIELPIFKRVHRGRMTSDPLPSPLEMQYILPRAVLVSSYNCMENTWYLPVQADLALADFILKDVQGSRTLDQST
jgi:hypothetical protein